MIHRLFLFFVILCCFITVKSVAQSTMTQEHNLPELFNDDGDDFVIIAHRGASAYYPENTLIAFKKAMEMGAEMIELDVSLSKDGIPVVFHDARLNKHTNGQGYLSNYTLNELKKLDAGSWFDPEFSDQKIPTLREVLELTAGTVSLNIEIKTEAVSNSISGEVEEKVLQLVEKHNMENHVLLSSFDYRALIHFKELSPDIPVALLYDRSQSSSLLPSQLVQKYNVDAFNCSYRQLRKKWIADLNKHQVPSFIYTVNSQRRMQKLIEAGVRGIFTDKPDLLQKVVESYHKESK